MLYLLPATIVLLLLFAVSFGRPATGFALTSSALSALLVAGCAFIANVHAGGAYFNALAIQTPTVLRAGVIDLAYAAEQTAASFDKLSQRNPEEDIVRPSPATIANDSDKVEPEPKPAAPSYRVVAAPPQPAGPVTAPLPVSSGTPVNWDPQPAVLAGMDDILLTGTNVSDAILEEIQATLKPDYKATPIGTGNFTLSLSVEGPNGTATPGASVPPGARFHLQAKDLSKGRTKQIGGAIVSFAYTLDGRRRTSIMYLKPNALN